MLPVWDAITQKEKAETKLMIKRRVITVAVDEYVRAVHCTVSAMLFTAGECRALDKEFIESYAEADRPLVKMRLTLARNQLISKERRSLGLSPALAAPPEEQRLPIQQV